MRWSEASHAAWGPSPQLVAMAKAALAELDSLNEGGQYFETELGEDVCREIVALAKP